MTKIQDVLKRHIISVQLMYDTFKRMGDADNCRYEQGLIDGLQRAIGIADNLDEEGPCGKHPLACYTPVVYEKHEPSGASNGEEWRTSCTVCAELAELRAELDSTVSALTALRALVEAKDKFTFVLLGERAAHAEQIVELTLEISRLQVKPIVDAEIGAENRMRGLKL